MRLIREYSAAEHFPEEESCSSFLLIGDQCWGLDGVRKCLNGFCCGKPQVKYLKHNYQKIVECPAADGYLAYEKNRQKKETVLHILDRDFPQLDAVCISVDEIHKMADDMIENTKKYLPDGWK